MLRLVEAVNLVDKEKCGAGIEEVLPLCLVDDLTNILDARSYGRQGFFVDSVTGSFKLPPAGDTVPRNVTEPVAPLFSLTKPARE